MRVYEVIEHTADGFACVRTEDTFHEAINTADALTKHVGLEFIVAENEDGRGGSVLYSSALPTGDSAINGVPTLARSLDDGERAGIQGLAGRI